MAGLRERLEFRQKNAVQLCHEPGSVGKKLAPAVCVTTPPVLGGRIKQFIGTAELIEGTNPEFEKVLLDIYPYEELATAMKIEPQQAREMVKKGMLLSKITINQVTVNSSAFEKDGMRKYQRWVRPAK